MSERICRWGILGAAQIARKNWESIRNTENATLVAVASRDLDRAQAFIDECQSQVPFPEAPKAVAGYENLLADPEIDAVYVPLPTGIRKEWVIRAAQAGKHVLCEKPCGANPEEVQEMIEACKAANVQFMDGVMFMHSSRLDSLRMVLEDEDTVGELKRIATQFSFRAPEEFLTGNIRVHSGLEPLGCVGDLGWYNVRFTLWTLGEVLPEKVRGHLHAVSGRSDSPDSVPMEFSGEMLFPGGISASFYCSFLTENQQLAHVSGTKGYVKLDDFVLPFFGSEIAFDAANIHFEVNGCRFNMEPRVRRVHVLEYSNNHPSSQETNLFRRFSELANSGEPDYRWADMALNTQRVLEACLQSARADGGWRSL